MLRCIENGSVDLQALRDLRRVLSKGLRSQLEGFQVQRITIITAAAEQIKRRRIIIDRDQRFGLFEPDLFRY